MRGRERERGLEKEKLQDHQELQTNLPRANEGRNNTMVFIEFC